MKLTLAVLVALGLTMVWQASVVADNQTQSEHAAQVTVASPTDAPQRG